MSPHGHKGKVCGQNISGDLICLLHNWEIEICCLTVHIECEYIQHHDFIYLYIHLFSYLSIYLLSYLCVSLSIYLSYIKKASVASPTAATFYFYKSFWSVLRSQALETPQLSFRVLNGRKPCWTWPGSAPKPPKPFSEPSPEPCWTWPRSAPKPPRTFSGTFSGTFSKTLLNLTWLCTKASHTFSETFSGLLRNLLRNPDEADLALRQSL